MKIQLKIQYIECLLAKGYVQEWEREPYIFVRKEGMDCFCVILLDNLPSVEQILLKRKEIETRYCTLGMSVRHLCILTQKDAYFSEEVMESVRRLPQVWLITETDNRVYRYENQPEEFDGLCEALEALPVESPTRTRTRIPWITLALVAVNLFCFVYPLQSGQAEDWLAAGWNNRNSVLKDGEWYRLLTYMFLHNIDSLQHIANNMFMLLIIGFGMEHDIGHVRFVLIYFISGVVAGLWSILSVRDGAQVSIGASGAIYGLLGAWLVLTVTMTLKKTYRGKRNYSIIAALLVCIYALFSGLRMPNVDNAAHFGGFFSGMLLLILTNKFRKNCT